MQRLQHSLTSLFLIELCPSIALSDNTCFTLNFLLQLNSTRSEFTPLYFKYTFFILKEVWIPACARMTATGRNIIL